MLSECARLLAKNYGYSQLLSRVLRTVSVCMIDLRPIYSVDALYAQYRMRNAILRNHFDAVSQIRQQRAVEVWSVRAERDRAVKRAGPSKKV